MCDAMHISQNRVSLMNSYCFAGVQCMHVGWHCCVCAYVN